MLNVDFDDIIIPRTYTDLRLEFYLLAATFPKAAAFEFLWALSSTRTSRSTSLCHCYTVIVAAQSPNNYSIAAIAHSAHIENVNVYGKSVLRPKRVRQSYLHYPVANEISPNYHTQRLTKNDTLVVHMRSLYTEVDPPSACCDHRGSAMITSCLGSATNQHLLCKCDGDRLL